MTPMRGTTYVTRLMRVETSSKSQRKCGRVTHLVAAGFEILTEAGYAPEMTYFECLNELKPIVVLIYEGGLSTMRYSVGDTAEYGDCTASPKIITEDTKRVMREILKDVQSGEWARQWVLKNKGGRPMYNAMHRQ